MRFATLALWTISESSLVVAVIRVVFLQGLTNRAKRVYEGQVIRENKLDGSAFYISTYEGRK